MLLMGMQKKNSDMDSLMEHLEFKGINVLNVFEGKAKMISEWEI